MSTRPERFWDLDKILLLRNIYVWVLMPRTYTEALEFFKANNNSTWYDAMKAEMDSKHSYEVFRKDEKAQYDKQKEVMNAAQGCHKIRVHPIFAVKYDGIHEARLVADGPLNPNPVESI